MALETKKYLSYDGLVQFWTLIKGKFVAEISQETSADSITLTLNDANGASLNKDVVLGAATTEKAGIMTAAMYKKLDEVSGTIEEAVGLKGIAFDNNVAKIATIGTGSDAKTKHINLNVIYDSESKTIQVVDLNNIIDGKAAILTSFDATEFIKDRFLKEAEFVEETKQLKLTFITENPATGEKGEETILVNLSALIDTYEAGNGLSLNGNQFSVKIKPGEKYLTVDANGLATTGIDTAISEAAGGALTDAKVYTDDEIEKAIGALTGTTGAITNALAEAKEYTDAEIGKVNAKIGAKAEGETPATGIYAEFDYLLSEDGQVGKNTAAIAILNGDDKTDGSVAKAANDALTAANEYTNGRIGEIGAETTVKDYVDGLAENYEVAGAASAVYNAMVAITNDEIAAILNN